MEHSCINYWGFISNSGYGLDYDPLTKKIMLAHRMTYRDFYGNPTGKIVMHTCNNKKCVNPLHLKLGTQSDNVRGAYKDGLQINPRRKLREDDVKHILSSSFSQRALAKYYGVTQKVINLIKQRKSYGEWTGKGGSCGS